MGETENETTNCLPGARPTGRAFTRAVIFSRDQAPVPPEQSFRSDDWNDLAQRVNSRVVRFSCEPDALTIGKARLPSELLPKDFDFLQQVIYQTLLVLIDPTSQVEQTELHRFRRDGASGQKMILGEPRYRLRLRHADLKFRGGHRVRFSVRA